MSVELLGDIEGHWPPRESDVAARKPPKADTSINLMREIDIKVTGQSGDPWEELGRPHPEIENTDEGTERRTNLDTQANESIGW